MQRYKLIVYFVFASFQCVAQQINLDAISTAPIPPDFVNVGMGGIQDQIRAEFDSNGFIDSAYHDPALMQDIANLSIKRFRFPGGTNANYYHFYGNGYGYDTSEIYCRANYNVNQTFFSALRRFDSISKSNVIHLFVDFIHQLELRNKTPEIVYMLNTHTHFFQGQLFRHTQRIHELLLQYSGGNITFLNTTLKDFPLNSSPTATVNGLKLLQNDTAIARIKRDLINDSAFYFRFKENLEALQFLKDNQITIRAIELGNEADANLLIFDDDLSETDFDCITPDTSANPFSITDLKKRIQLEGLVKYWLVTSLYADSLAIRFPSISLGIPQASPFWYIDYVAPNAVVSKRITHLYKHSELWNLYFSSQEYVDAMIPHIYFQDYISCSRFENEFGNTEDVLRASKAFISVFIDSLLPAMIFLYREQANNKPLWITEWNFNLESYLSNTFLQSYFIHRFIAKIIQLSETIPNSISEMMLHLLVAPHFGFPPLRGGYQRVGDSFFFSYEKQLSYEPLFNWGNTVIHQPLKISVPLDSMRKLGVKHSLVDLYYHPNSTTIDLLYANTTGNVDTLLFSKLAFQKSISGVPTPHESIKIKYRQLNATTPYATNYTVCNYLSNFALNEYQISIDSLNYPDTFLIPGNSIGKLCIELKPISISNLTNSTTNAIRIFPNPTHGEITIEVKQNYIQNGRLKLISLLGSVVYEDVIAANQHTPFRATILLPKGMFFVQLHTNNDVISSTPIIVQ